MGGVNHQMTNQHATLSASQSMTFSMGGVTPGAPVALPTMPLSRSQQVGTVHIEEGLATPPFVVIGLFLCCKNASLWLFSPRSYFSLFVVCSSVCFIDFNVKHL